MPLSRLPAQRGAWYTALCIIWGTVVGYAGGALISRLGLQNGYTYFCYNALVDLITIFFITRVHVPFFTKWSSWVLVMAIMLNAWGWLDYRYKGFSEWFDQGMDLIMVLQILVFLGADIGLRMGRTPVRFFDRLRTRRRHPNQTP